MAIQLQGNSGVVAEVPGTSFRALSTNIKPIEYATLGHYRTSHRCVLAATQAANSRLFILRNNSTNLIVPTRLAVKLLQTAAGTAQIAGIDAYRLTGFTVLDTTNTVTPSVSVKRTSMAAAPGNAQVRGVTAAGAAAGMTGGTSTKDGTAFWQFSYPVAAAAATSNAGLFGPYDLFDDVNGTHPFVLAQNEGLLIENRALNTTSFGFEAIFEIAWAEVTAY